MHIKIRSHYFFIIFFSMLAACKENSTLLKEVPSSHSHIEFNNAIIENDTLNPLDVTNLYNGGGVGIGDFNNDGLQDIYFTGNVVQNKLYLNLGKLQFKDVTEESHTTGEGKWCRGVAVVDINNDGLMDIYLCATISKDPQKRKNILYINQGPDQKGIPQFRDMAAEYGLDDTTHSTMASFFDYDNDGDLDVYITVNEILDNDIPSVFRPKITDGSHPSTGRLYRNDWNEKLKHGVFTNVSNAAGITIEGYGHGATIADFNLDGWKDIFVTNDFNSNDLLYINNHDGTFTDRASQYFKHTSANGMGQDVVDINNDGLSDVIELDMNPEDNYRKKMMMNANNYQVYQNSDYYGYQYQYVRNTLQLNMGKTPGNRDSAHPVFSDIGFFSGIAETDWSWAPVVSDFDNDGFRDIIITNGFPKDLTDHDFIAFRKNSHSIATKEFTLSQIPQVKIHNYAYHNKGDCTFENVTKEWGLEIPTFSNGAVYADLDNDGDMDIVINNINDKALLYENTSNSKNPDNKVSFLNVKLIGDSLNRNGLGAWVDLYYQGKQQAYEQNPYRGYLSTVQLNPHFGLGSVKEVDSLVIRWPGSQKQVIKKPKLNSTVEADIRQASEKYSWNNLPANASTFTDVTDSVGIDFVHRETDFIDFNIQKLLPHKFSEYGPLMTSGDVNGDGLEDFVIGGSAGFPAEVFIQKPNGQFAGHPLPVTNSDDMGLVLFDADGDKDLDLYISSGGFRMSAGDASYQDRLYINDGKGNFQPDSFAIPVDHGSKSCVRVIDFDKDGDPDLFIGGRVIPWQYPKPASSLLLRNDSKNGKAHFTNVTTALAPMLDSIGLVCDAVVSDFDNDGWPDIVLAGEWMPVTFLKNVHGRFENITSKSGIQNELGWWTSIAAGDFDKDGKVDFVVGNLGLNSFYRASEKYPVHIYAGDFDNNGSYDAIPTLFLPTSMEDPDRKEYPAQVRDDLVKQMVIFRKSFQDYKSFAKAPFSKMLSEAQLKSAFKLQVNNFHHSLLHNIGGGKFELAALPQQTQYSCLNQMIVGDFNKDGNPDLLAVGNDYGTEVNVGRYDACNGLYLTGNGKGGFSVESLSQSGFYVPGNARSVIRIANSNGQTLIVASQNRGPVRVFKLN